MRTAASSSLASGALFALLLVALLPPAMAAPPAPELAGLGRQIFFDASLSASGRLSCASCHSPQHAYGPPNALAVQMGGRQLDREGVRAVPSLRYTLNRTPVWSRAYQDNPAERLLEGEAAPSGGLGWDGRFDSPREQASFPLLSAYEMANGSRAQLVERIARARYAPAFRHAFGAGIFERPESAFAAAMRALERFELDDPSFHPYSSRYDDYLDGRGALTPQELRGRALFDDPQRGNCASCHPDRRGADGSHPLFSNYQFEALGVPRNRELAASARADWFDAGLCGPLRRDQPQQTFCGMFKTPGLRNVASRSAFFHNGRFHTLREALRFYVRRDTDPQLWYPRAASGAVEKFDDLPPRWRGNVDVTDAPLNLARGATPVWNDDDIDAVLAFLATLTDRDVAAAPSAAINLSAPATAAPAFDSSAHRAPHHAW